MDIDSCHPSISSFVIPFSCPQPFPASGSFPMTWFFASGGQSSRASASASVLPINIQDWFSLGLTGWIPLLSKRLLRVFSSTTVSHQFFGTSNPVWCLCTATPTPNSPHGPPEPLHNPATKGLMPGTSGSLQDTAVDQTIVVTDLEWDSPKTNDINWHECHTGLEHSLCVNPWGPL